MGLSITFATASSANWMSSFTSSLAVALIATSSQAVALNATSSQAVALIATSSHHTIQLWLSLPHRPNTQYSCGSHCHIVPPHNTAVALIATSSHHTIQLWLSFTQRSKLWLSLPHRPTTQYSCGSHCHTVPPHNTAVEP